MEVKLIQFKNHDDERGALTSLEKAENIPFEINRIYYLHSTKPGVRRGFHAHKKLKQIAVALKGSCKFLLDDGKKKATVCLDSPEQGLYIDSLLWREMFDFSDDCVLLVLADEVYDESDYIRDYEKFLREVRSNES